MDFINFINDQTQRLRTFRSVEYLWTEIHNETVPNDEDKVLIEEFHSHLPLVMQEFWETAFKKLVAFKGDFQELNGNLKIYLIVLLEQSTDQSYEFNTFKSIFYASQVYMHLLANLDDYYKFKIYHNVLTFIKTSNHDFLFHLLGDLRKFLSRFRLETHDLQFTLDILTNIIFLKTKKIYNDFSLEIFPECLVQETLLCLKILYFNEIEFSRKFLIISYLFNGLRKCSSYNHTPYTFSVIQTNYRNLLKDLHTKFEEDQYRSFMNAFLHVWVHPDCHHFNEVVEIMNSLNEIYYRILLDRLNKMLSSSNAIHKNLFKLSEIIIHKPSSCFRLEKIKVNNQILIYNIALNILSRKNDISQAAIETFSSILLCTLENENERIVKPLESIINSSEHNVLNASSMLKAFQTLIVPKWSNKIRNKQLFVICLSIMYYSTTSYPEIYYDVLELFEEDASPYELKSYIRLLSDVYLKMCERKCAITSKKILKFLFKLALHPLASSHDFLKYLYTSMIHPTLYKNRPIKRELFINPIITNEFQYNEFFTKCHTVGLIKKEHLIKFTTSLSALDENDLKLLCCLVQFADYKDITLLANYIGDNSNTLYSHPNLHYILYLYNEILKNNSEITSNEFRINNDIVLNFLKRYLNEQNLRWNAVSDAFALLKNVAEENDVFTTFKENYDQILMKAIEKKDCVTPFVYYSQLVIFGKVLPNEAHIIKIRNILQSIMNSARCEEVKLWLGCLFLYTNICLIKTELTEMGIQFLEHALRSEITVVRFVALTLFFDLSNMVTQNFNYLVNYMFREITNENLIFQKACVEKIDYLVRNDYLRLDFEQFLLYISLLGNDDLNVYMNRLLSESFFISNTNIIAKYFVPFIIYLNDYQKHPLYIINTSNYATIQRALKKISKRHKLYSMLFGHLPNKLRFNVAINLAQTVFELVMSSKMKCDEGYWGTIKDSIFVYRILAENKKSSEIYKKVMGLIPRFILEKNEYTGRRSFIEFQNDILKGITTLMKFLFFSHSDLVHKHIKATTFDAIIHWTDYFMPEIIHLVHMDCNENLKNFYSRLDIFYKKNCDKLMKIDILELGSIENTDSPEKSSVDLFHISDQRLSVLSQVL